MRTLVTFVAALLLPCAVHAQDIPLSKKHFERGLAEANLGHHDLAIQEFELAYRANARPSILYNIAQEHRVLAEAGALDQMRVSVEFYQRYLQSQPNAANRADVEGTIADLKARIESTEANARPVPLQALPPPPAKAALEDAPRGADVSPDAITQPRTATSSSEPKRRLPTWAWVLIGASAAVAAGTAVGLGVGLSQNRVPPSSTLGTQGVPF